MVAIEDYLLIDAVVVMISLWRYETMCLNFYRVVYKPSSIWVLLAEILDLNVRLCRLNVMNDEIVALVFRIVVAKYSSEYLQAAVVAENLKCC